MNANVVQFPKQLGAVTADFTPIMKGARGPLVSSFQSWLHKRGFTPGLIDGIYGNQTAAAVRELQKTLRVAQTGNFDQPTITAVKADLALRKSMIRDLETENITRPMPAVTTSKLVPQQPQPTPTPTPDDPNPPPDALRNKLLLGAGVATVGLAVLMLVGRKRNARPLAGENLFDLGREDEDGGADDDDVIRSDDPRVSKEYMKELADDYARRLADRFMEMMATRTKGGRRVEKADAVEGLGDANFTMKDLRAVAKSGGLTVKRTDGEYRIAPKGVSRAKAEAQAYYTADIDDAVATAKDMAERAALSGPPKKAKKKKAKVRRARRARPDRREDVEHSYPRREPEYESSYPMDDELEDEELDLADAPSSTPKGKMQGCARQWSAMGSDKGGTSYREFMKSCMRS